MTHFNGPPQLLYFNQTYFEWLFMINNLISGAVANGRAKFEAQTTNSAQSCNSEKGNTQKISPEKPLRFFGSRSRTNSPMLPVKTPKVPTSVVIKKDDSAPINPKGQTAKEKLVNKKESKPEDKKKDPTKKEPEEASTKILVSKKLVLSKK